MALGVPTDPASKTAAAVALVNAVSVWNTSFVAGIVGVRFLLEALVDVGHGDVAMKLVGRDTDACNVTFASCTFSQQLAAGPGTIWESWDNLPDASDNASQVWTGSSLNHIMFGGGPGVFIHEAGGIARDAWTSRHAEVTFRLDARVAETLGGATLWSESVRGEASLMWRLHAPSLVFVGPTGDRVPPARVHAGIDARLSEWLEHADCDAQSLVLSVEVVGPAPRTTTDSWHLEIPTRTLVPNGGAAHACGETNGANGIGDLMIMGGPAAVGIALEERGNVLTLRGVTGHHHVFGMCVRNGCYDRS